MKVVPISISFKVFNEVCVFDGFKQAIATLSKKQKTNFLTGQLYQDLLTVYTEGVANAIQHADEIQKNGFVHCRFKLTARNIEIKIEDHGPGYLPKKVPIPNFEDLHEGGRGVFMMNQLMDFVAYKRQKKKNMLVLKKTLVGRDPSSRNLDLLYEISDAILETEDLESVCGIILDKALEIFGVERASILLYDREKRCLKVVASRGLHKELSSQIQVKPGEGVSGYVFQHSKPCLIEDIQKNKAGWQTQKQYKSRSFISVPMICSPLRVGQESMGVINLTDRPDGRPFTKKDLRLLTTIANQAAAYLHIFRLVNLTKETESLRREFEIARLIQQSTLPESPPAIGELELTGWLETAQSVGGDYYDFISLDEKNFYVLVCDVSGHNVGAAMMLVSLRSQLKALFLMEKDPGRLLTLLNNGLFDDLKRHDQFVSMILVRYLRGEKKMELAIAGHPFPMLIRDDQVEFLSANLKSDLVLGVQQNECYETFSFSLNSGDQLFFYTDGVFDTIDGKGNRFGMAALAQFFRQSVSKNPAEILEKLKKVLHQFRGDTPLVDDVTAVVLKQK